MRLYTFEEGGRRRIGAESKGRLVDLAAAHEAARAGGKVPGEALPPDLLDLIRRGPAGLEAARRALAYAGELTGAAGERLHHALAEVRLLAPLPRPGKILCSGINYRSHLEENPGARLPESPFFFAKLPSAVIGPGEAIVLPRESRQVDYEVELAVVIGKRLKRAAPADALAAVAGYTILHDVSARDVQFKDSQITLGKNFDTFAPLGPCLVTTDEVPDPGNLRLRALVNGRVLQESSTREWVFPLPVLLATLSCHLTLEPGDVVSTGTPAGVGYFRKPQVFLRAGDVVALEVEGIGRLENPVVAEG